MQRERPTNERTNQTRCAESGGGGERPGPDAQMPTNRCPPDAHTETGARGNTADLTGLQTGSRRAGDAL